MPRKGKNAPNQKGNLQSAWKRMEHNFPVSYEPFEDIAQMLMYRQMQGVIDGFMTERSKNKTVFNVLGAYFKERHADAADTPPADFAIAVRRTARGYIHLTLGIVSDDAKRVFYDALNINRDVSISEWPFRFEAGDIRMMDQRYKFFDSFTGYAGRRLTEMTRERGFSVPMPIFY